MPLNDDDIRAIVARAEQLQHTGDFSGDELEALVRAGEDIGISRSAMQRALQERLGTPLNPQPGEVVFARAPDEKYYVAEVLADEGDEYRVRFLRGGERLLAHNELRACSFLPGERIVCPWPGWGAWTCTVLSYDAAEGHVTVTDGWAETATFPISDVWLAPRTAAGRRRARIYAALLAAGAAVGAAVGAIVTAFVL
jgi:hypothetical protein